MKQLRHRPATLDGEASQFPCAQEYAGEHGAVQAACVGVAKRRMIAGEEMQSVGKDILGAVREVVDGFASNDAGMQEMSEVSVEGYFAEADHHANARKGLDLL